MMRFDKEVREEYDGFMLRERDRKDRVREEVEARMAVERAQDMVRLSGLLHEKHAEGASLTVLRNSCRKYGNHEAFVPFWEAAGPSVLEGREVGGRVSRGVSAGFEYDPEHMSVRFTREFDADWGMFEDDRQSVAFGLEFSAEQGHLTTVLEGVTVEEVEFSAKNIRAINRVLKGVSDE